MSQYYTVTFAQPLDGTDNYGNITYSVKFAEEADSALWRVQPGKTQITPGMKVYGHIETPLGQKSGKPYRKFVRDQVEEGGTDQPAKTYKPGDGNWPKKDNSDGMRQGMCINNAAAYIAATAQDERFASGEAWAKEVHAYATALYNLGDLIQAATEPTQTTEPYYATTGSQLSDGPADSAGNVDPVSDEEQIDMSAIDKMFSSDKAIPANR